MTMDEVPETDLACLELTSVAEIAEGLMDVAEFASLLPSLPEKVTGISSGLYTIREFCQATRISQRHYYRLRAEGDGPRTTSLGGKVLITRYALDEWLDEHQE